MNPTALWQTATDRWVNIQGEKRRQTVIIAAVSCVVLLALLYLVFRPQYITVFHNLTLEDSAAIVSELKARRIPYKLEGGGTSIAVPPKQADQARLEVAAAGLPRTGRVGYDIFAKSGWGMTESERNLQMQLLLEQQLTQTLLKISGIQDANVKLALPRENVFLDPRRQTTASASIWLRSSMPLDSTQVNGIVHLVAHAVPNLSHDNVTVIDDKGRVLNGSNSAGAVDQQSLVGSLQTELERSLSALLGQVFGPDNVIVRVNADMEFTERVRETVRFEAPQGGQTGLVRQIRELSEFYQSEGGSVGGEPGTGSNASGNGELTPDGSFGSSLHESREREILYELDEIRETIVYSPGELKRLSVSVIVNREDLGGDEEKIREAVQAAIGYDSVRKDVVSVQSMVFASAEAPGLPATTVPWYETAAVRYSLMALFAVVALLVLRSVLGKHRVLVEELQPAPVAATLEEAKELPELKLPADTEAQRLRKQLESMVKQKPQEVSQLVRAWLHEE